MPQPEKKLHHTFEEYLTLEEKADYKSEFYNGEIFAKSGGTGDHSLISTNATRELGNALIERDCYVYGSDLKVRIESENTSVYPDGMVICGTRENFEDRRDVVTNPIVVIEVLSDSTAAWDRGGKFRQYRSLVSLQEYVLIEQKEAQVDVFRRNEQGLWVLEGYRGLDAKIEFKTLGITIRATRIFHGIQFPD